MVGCIFCCEKSVTLYDYVTFNQFRELRELLQILHWKPSILIGLFFCVYIYLVYIGFVVLANNIDILIPGQSVTPTQYPTCWRDILVLVYHKLFCDSDD